MIRLIAAFLIAGLATACASQNRDALADLLGSDPFAGYRGIAATLPAPVANPPASAWGATNEFIDNL